MGTQKNKFVCSDSVSPESIEARSEKLVLEYGEREKKHKQKKKKKKKKKKRERDLTLLFFFFNL